MLFTAKELGLYTARLFNKNISFRVFCIKSRACPVLYGVNGGVGFKVAW